MSLPFMKTKLPHLLCLMLCACAWNSSAQSLDSSGDSMLNGTYYVRQVFYIATPGSSSLAANVSIAGTITFNGGGGYTFSGSYQNSASTPSYSAFSGSGSYVISASGQGYISSIYSQFSNDRIVGLVSHGVFIGSSTETGSASNDLLIAAPVGSQQATNATLNGAYAIAYFDPTVPGDASFTLNANGSGGVGTVSVTAYTGSSSTASNQSVSGVTYSFSNGAAQVKFGGKRSSSEIIAGNEVLYITPDGNFVFGGSSTGYDMFVGVRAATSAPSNFPGLFYQAGLNLDESSSSGVSGLDSYYGAFQALANGGILGHQRFSTSSSMDYQNQNSLLIYGGANDFTYYDSYTLNNDGTSVDSAFNQHYVSSTDGTIRIGYGIGPSLGINVAFQEPPFSGSNVYLNPVGVVNAASSAPFTAQVAPGEFLTLYGSGLANTTASATLPFPTTFNGVQVFVNQTQAPIYYVSPTQISIVVPYGTTADSVAQIYVINNGANSNSVSAFTGSTSVGVFTNPAGGLGYAAALHPDYSVISKSSPAQIGETVAVYLAGMGIVIPPVQDGAAASMTTLSTTTATPLVYLLDAGGNYLHAKVSFSGLAPGYAGLYQINFAVPPGTASGDATIEIVGPDSDAFQALLPIGSGGGDAVPSPGNSVKHALPRRHVETQ